MPFNIGIVIGDIKLSLLFTLAISSLGVYGFLVAGWASNSKYAFLGALRAAAQMVSYEVSLGLIIMVIVIATNSFNFTEIVISQRFGIYFFCFFPNFLMFIITVLAETNRTPFDLPEAEGELVAGYNVEYSGVGFAYFFIAEYVNIILMSALLVNVFLGG
jgi:NADH-quinone oxidoreductase subunit H